MGDFSPILRGIRAQYRTNRQPKAIYPAIWGVLQTITGAFSDRWGRKGLIVAGMWVQAVGLFVTAATRNLGWGFLAGVLLGPGIAMVNPTLIASVSDASHPVWRARSLSVYRFRRDLGYAMGVLAARIMADPFGAARPNGATGVLTLAPVDVTAVTRAEHR